MANDATTIDALNELLSAQKQSILLRLPETAPFVSSADAALAQAVRGIIREDTEHLSWLAEAIIERDGCPASVVPDPRTASIHYVELRYLLPQIMRDERRVMRACEAVAERVMDTATAELAVRMADRHRRHLDELNEATHTPA